MCKYGCMLQEVSHIFEHAWRQKSCLATFRALLISLDGVKWKVLKSSLFMMCVPFGRVICFMS